MDIIPPLDFDWDGEALHPARPKQADLYYVVGATYRLAPYEDRSVRSHNHYFAAVAEAWKNLPEELGDRFASPEHLRKYALIKAGYRDERSIGCPTPPDALRMAAFIKPMDDYAVVVTEGSLVTVYTAKSQSVRAMGKKRFQESKDAVLDVLAGLAGVSTATLAANAGRAA